MSKEHDYSRGGWGHDVVVRLADSGGLRLDLTGWGFGLKAGDSIILPNTTHGGTTRYRLDSVKYETDPPDMWSATATFFPRPAP